MGGTSGPPRFRVWRPQGARADDLGNGVGRSVTRGQSGNGSGIGSADDGIGIPPLQKLRWGPLWAGRSRAAGGGFACSRALALGIAGDGAVSFGARTENVRIG